ncbi:TetR/AcrR family transcriptional regulator [Ideonella azotifigens]|uniref:TetR/AcrR family transcriptional regulator n=1 Tax=Ideonella azotifigens TaxID=513160 RepID=A0ABN1JRV7_9BURK
MEAIVTAGARVLGTRGWTGFTTNEVAQVAGVSIGSLYQYFPNKVALVDAIRRRHLETVLAAVSAGCNGDKPAGQLVDDLVGGLIAAHSIEPEVHRVLLDELPRAGQADADKAAFMAEYLASYKLLIARHCGGAPEAVSDLSAQVLSATVEGVIHDFARRGMLDAPTLQQELVRLVRAYLLGLQAQGMPVLSSNQ